MIPKIKVSFKEYDDTIHNMIRNGHSVDEAITSADDVMEVVDSEF
jgi:hypothetical protein